MNYATARRGQSGVTLIEILIAFVVAGLLMTSASFGLVGLLRHSAATNSQARADALVGGFGQVLKQLEYRPCADPGDYETAFDDYESSLPSSQHLRREGGEVSVVSVDAGDRCDSSIDAGTQVINITAEFQGRESHAQIVKRDPDASPRGPTAIIDDPPEYQSESGDLLFSVLLTARSSVVPAGVLRLDWDCGDEAFVADDFPGEYSTTTLDDSGVLCTYRATDEAQTITVSLTLTDLELATDTDTMTLVVPAAGEERANPTAVFTYVQTSQSGISGSTQHNPSTVVFNAAGSYSTDGGDLTYRWSFSDPSTGALNESTSVNPTHVFAAAGSYEVRLTVTDDFGLTGTSSQIITVLDSGSSPPTPIFTMTPTSGVAPQLVSFDATASHTAGGGPVSSYTWNFGDGGAGTGATPTHRYATAGTYLVTLTVTDGAGNSASTAQSVVLGTLMPPLDFVMYDAEGELADHGRFYFSWSNVAGSPGDVISYEIRVWALFGSCVSFGDRTREVAASGVAGTAQTYTWVETWPFSSVCLWSTYYYQVRTKRVSLTEGTTYSDWSSQQSKYVDHT